MVPKATWKRLERGKPLKRGKRMNKIGPKTQTWIDVRKDIKQRFEWAGITACEARLLGCWFNDGLGFAHCKKRRKIEGDELWHVVLLCNHCHDIWEKLPHAEMHNKIHAIIDRRGLIAPPAILQQV
jgi:hypothetical protein